MKSLFHRLILIAVGVTIVTSFTSVKAYQKGKLNDSEMTLSNKKIQKTELSFQPYREGSSGANAGESGGGCGCN